jgi:hypothetical protein
MSVESIEHGLALIALGELRSDEIPELALLILEHGCDLPAIAALASGTRSDDPIEVRSDFIAALRSAGYRVPDKMDGARTLMRICAKQALCGTRPARDAAREIIWTYQEVTHDLPKRSKVFGEEFGISGVAGAYYAYDDVPLFDDDAKGALDAELLAELRKFDTESGA